MPNYTGVYSASFGALAVTGAITILQIKAGSTRGFEIIRAWVTQSNQGSIAQQRVQLLRKTGAASVTSLTPVKIGANQPAADAAGGASATGYNASGEGTDGDVIIHDCFDVLSGWLYIPVPEERITVPVAGMVALKFPAAPAASMTVSAGIIFGEIG